MVFATPGQGIAFQWRGDGGSYSNWFSNSQTAPAWIKLVRSGDDFTAFYSTDVPFGIKLDRLRRFT